MGRNRYHAVAQKWNPKRESGWDVAAYGFKFEQLGMPELAGKLLL